jgi:hypothetical protein
MPVRGAQFEFAQHHDHGVTELWEGRKAAATAPRVSAAYRVDIVVDDLEAATAPLVSDLPPHGSDAHTTQRITVATSSCERTWGERCVSRSGT